MNLKLIKNQPAGRWGEAFPVGNGHMGAMIYASLPMNRIELSENTFFSGEKSNSNNQKDAYKAFYEMRKLASEGAYDKVHEKAEQFIGVRHDYGSNLPVGKLLLDYGIAEASVTGYERKLDIMNGMTACTFTEQGHVYKEELFVSHPDNILVQQISMEGKSGITITFEPGNSYGKTEYGEHSILFTCYAYEELHCDKLCGVTLVGYATVVTDGICTSNESGLVITDAMDIKIYLQMKTSFKCNFQSCEETVRTLSEEVKNHVIACSKKDYLELKKRHIKDVKGYMDRVYLRLDDKEEAVDKLPFLFQYGRYLLLSSSREDSMLPAHLQGIWNDNVACRIGWTCDMHLDINTQMNYWPSEVTNLSETAAPLVKWIKEDLSAAGERTAKESYGLEGWVAELVSNAWGFAAPYWASPIAPCPTGGVWILMQLWEHYLYSEEDEFLSEYAFPLIEASVRFFLGYLFEDKNSGYLTCGPSISPENSFLYKNIAYQISNGCTYEILMIRELFIVYLSAGRILNHCNSDLYVEVSDKLNRLLPYRITGEGTIAEWNHDLAQADVQHRHTSHLLGLFPFSQINTEETPDLCEAAEKTIQAKLTPIENWEDTGWARSMLMLYEARLKNGNNAYEHIKSMVKHLLEPNHLVYHPPTRGAGAFDHVYELDGNTGLTTCIAEMLLQSHGGRIQLLPALPDKWRSGEVKGLRARGDITVDMAWEDGRLTSATLTANRTKECTVFYSGQEVQVRLEKKQPYKLFGNLN